MSVVDAVRSRLAGDPTTYERAWLTSINVVGLVVVLGVLFDSRLLLGTGQTGIFQRALYPVVPPAVTLGVGLAVGSRRGVALSALTLLAYAVVLAAVGTLGTALAVAPRYPLAGLLGVVALAGVGYGWGRQSSRSPE